MAISEAKKEKPVLFTIKDTRDDLKKQLEISKRAQNAYVMLLDTREFGSATKWFGELQRIFTDINQRVGELLQKYETSDIVGNSSTSSYSGIKLE